MEEFLGFSINVAMGFFAISNPIGNTPLFYSFVEEFDDKQRRKVALRAVITAFIIITLFTLMGKLIFKGFGITLPAFQITGGIIAFIIGYERLHGRRSHVHNMNEKETENYGNIENVATYPLAIPMLAGPGTISTAMSFSGEHQSMVYTLLVVGIYALMSLVTYLFWVFGEKILKLLTPGIIKVITRIMGLIVAVISVQMVIFGIKNAIELYVK